MEKFISFMDNLPKVVKVIFCFWILDIFWAVYRIVVGIKAGDPVKILLAILWIIAAGTVGWILDLIWIICFDHIFWFKN